MNATRPLNARQREVLEWIGDGCPEGVMKDFTYKTTAVALQSRHLVAVSRKGGGWTAVTTEAGDHYLRHGSYPASMRASRQPITVTTAGVGTASGTSAGVPSPRQDSRLSIAPRQPRAPSIDEQAEDLVARVIRLGAPWSLTPNTMTQTTSACARQRRRPRTCLSASSCAPAIPAPGGRANARSL